MGDFLSLVVPLYNEEEKINSFLDSIKIFGEDIEVIFVDGGSRDETLKILEKSPYSVYSGPKGRGRQINYGIQKSSGDRILILHADTFFKENPEKKIKKTLEKEKIGCFTLQFIENTRGLRMVAKNSSRRVKYRNIAFGDQGMFFSREYYNELGGFKEIDFMEDYDFSIRVKERGDKIVLLDQKIYSSGRRFIDNGLWRTILIMQKAQSMYRRGKSIEEIRSAYKLSRGS